ncbi:MAG: hypothetical protein OXU42_17335 [Deltaproteobacteria bacterium]|nr:hypothetical protein [Deltaproteobacteria bacterium]
MVRPAGPSAGAGTGDGELLLALESEAEGLTQREIACGSGAPSGSRKTGWSDGWMRTRVKRRRRRGRTILKQYRDMATRT